MNRELFDQIDILKANTHVPSCGLEDNPRAIGAAYERAISVAGGIDLQILGIGSNGHIGFNEPCSSLSSRTRMKILTESTVNDNSRLFSAEEFQPHLAVTMGIASILESRRDARPVLCKCTKGPPLLLMRPPPHALNTEITFVGLIVKIRQLLKSSATSTSWIRLSAQIILE